MSEAKVTVPLDEFLELKKFKEEIISGKKLVMVNALGHTSNYMKNVITFYSPGEDIEKINKEFHHLKDFAKTQEELIKEKDHNINLIVYRLGVVEKELDFLKHASIRGFLRWRKVKSILR